MPLTTSPADFTLLVTDRNLTVVGDPIASWTNLDTLPTFNEPGSGSVVVPASNALQQQIAGTGSDGLRRLVVIRDGAIFSSGLIEVPGEEEWSVDGENSGSGVMVIRFTDDLARPATRVTYPNPAAASTAQTSTARWTSTGNAEDIMRSLVNLNAGPGALSYRQIPKLILGADQGVGSTIKFGTRFEPLCDALRRAAIAGGGLGFRTQQVGTNIEFQVYQPVDRSGTVRFSKGLGNLRQYKYEPALPTATAAIVGGKDVGTSRLVVERTNATAISRYERMEKFVDQRQSEDTSADTTELNQAGDEALVNGAETARLSAVTIDTPDQQFGVHYQLGDKVSVELGSGAVVTDVVRAVHLQVTPEAGEVVTALVGSQDASADPLWVKYMRELARRLDRLETI